MECKREKNLKSCNCSYDCEKKGMCCDCVREHRARGELPACYFDCDAERAYDRSIERFISLRKA